jgi:hypothetical protein
MTRHETMFALSLAAMIAVTVMQTWHFPAPPARPVVCTDRNVITTEYVAVINGHRAR